jgi:hypothetical protein
MLVVSAANVEQSNQDPTTRLVKRKDARTNTAMIVRFGGSGATWASFRRFLGWPRTAYPL